jgi:hypothetical protein
MARSGRTATNASALCSYTRPMLGGRLKILACLLTVCAVGLGAASASAASRVPGSFIGVQAGPPLEPQAVSDGALSQQIKLMATSGVQSMRFALYWGAMQPYASWSDVPAEQKSQFSNDGIDNVPTQFGPLDTLVGDAARSGISLLPSVLAAPGWDGKGTPNAITKIPVRTAPYASFLKVLIKRYGPRGTFWATHHPKYAIRSWQIWNEPNETSLWPIQPFAKDYVALLRAAHAAIKQADRSAKVVLAGFPSAPGNTSWGYLAQIYGVKGARGLFDVAGVHPYTKQPAGVITIIGKMRQVMNQHGDRNKPLIADEMGWPSSVGKTKDLFGFETNEAGQARNIAAVLPLLANARKRLGLSGFYIYTWTAKEVRNAYTFDFSGLLRYTGTRFVAKPALSAFKRVALKLEGCRSKSVGNRCKR